MKFISHLDMTRFASRALRRAHLPVWYTEGFNPHPYITFALPLSLGMTSDYEIMDIRLTDDGYDTQNICERLNAVCPSDLRFFDAAEPRLKTGELAFADYEITFNDGGALKNHLADFFERKEIPVTKKNKKGELKQFDAAEKIRRLRIECDKNTRVFITLPAGGNDNLNPTLILEAFFSQPSAEYFCYTVCRTALLDKNLCLFK